MSDIRQSICSELEQLNSGAENVLRFSTSFRIDAGDLLPLRVEEADGVVTLSDEGFVFSRLSEDFALNAFAPGTLRHALLKRILREHDVCLQNYELRRVVANADFGSAFFALTQASIQIYDLRFHGRERSARKFKDLLKQIVLDVVPAQRVTIDWHDAGRDLHQLYKVDLKIETEHSPLFLFALSSELHASNATISWDRFHAWGVANRTVGVKNESNTETKAVRRFVDVTKSKLLTLSSAETFKTDLRAVLEMGA